MDAVSVRAPYVSGRRQMRSAKFAWSSPPATAPTCRRSSTRSTGATGSRSSGSAPTSRGRGRWSGPRRPGSRPPSSPARVPETGRPRRGDGRLGRIPRRRPRRPRRLHAAAERTVRRPLPQPRSSTSTPRCCRTSPASTRSARRWRRGSRRPGSPSTSSTRASTPARRSSSARSRCPPGRDRAQLEAAIHAVEHELYPEAIRMIAEGRVRIDADDPGSVAIDD